MVILEKFKNLFGLTPKPSISRITIDDKLDLEGAVLKVGWLTVNFTSNGNTKSDAVNIVPKKQSQVNAARLYFLLKSACFNPVWYQGDILLTEDRVNPYKVKSSSGSIKVTYTLKRR
jgi:hypothetical protein